MKKFLSVIVLLSLIMASGCSGAVTETTATTESSVTSETTEATTTTSATEKTTETTTETTVEEEEEDPEEEPVDDEEENQVYKKLDGLPEKDADKAFDKLEDSKQITGDVIGINKDGDTLYGLFAKKVRLSEKKVKSFKVGDSIGYKDIYAEGEPELKVSKISKDGKHLMIELSTSDDPEDYCQWTIFWNDNGYYEITGASDIVYAEEIGYMAVPIASGCKITDSFSYFADEETIEAYKKAGKTGIPVFDTLFWFYESGCYKDSDSLYKLRDNGWYAADVSFNATIKDGKIVKLHFWGT